ncbi:MAG: hypothetical protein HY716_15400 [Planctomycetes bacterium]|nr:hypothetical protein [Planctomycetota bacterium]
MMSIEPALDGTWPAQIVKENAARLVRRVTPPQGPALYLKLFKDRGIWARLRRLLADRAAHEFAVLEHLRRANIAAPIPVACGVREGCSYLATEEIAGAKVLKAEAAGRHWSRAERVGLMDALGRFVRRVHDAGVRHDDLHLGNILFVGSLGHPTLYIIDAHRASRRSRISLESRIRALGFLLLSMQPFFGVTDQLRFLRAYDRSLSLERVRRAYEVARERYAASRAARCIATGTQFQAERGAWLRRPMTLREARDLIHAKPLHEIKSVGRRRLWLVASDRFVREDPRAAAIWMNAHALDVRHVATPRLWARVGTRLVGEWLTDAQPLDAYVASRFPAWPPSRRREFAFRLARFVRGLHRNGVYHHDLKANNVLVRERPGESLEFFAVDVDRVSFFRAVPAGRRLYNLAQLNAALGAPVTWGDRLAFYRSYAGHNREWNREWKVYAAHVMRLTRERKHRWPAR